MVATGRHLAGGIDAAACEWRWDKDGQLAAVFSFSIGI